ncbi:MAG: GNAT family N-acetyltransferase [Bacteroidota bacterium]
MTGAAPLIRKARRADRDGALALWHLLQEEHEAKDSRYRISEDAASRWSTDFRSWTRAHTSSVWVAEADDRLVGLLTAHLVEPAPVYAGLPFVFVGEIVVTPDWRGHGVAGRMLGAAREWGLQLGAGDLRAGVLATNPAGRRFWERQGATDFSVTVTMPLEEPGGGADTGA